MSTSDPPSGEPHGVRRYVEHRQSSRLFRDGLASRTEQVCRFLTDVCPRSDFRLLDVGTADGHLLGQVRVAFSGCHAIGIDSDPEAVRVARGRGFEVSAADGRRLPFPDRAFDVVVLSAILKHIRDPQLALREARRVLTPGGHLIYLEPTPWGLRVGRWFGHFDRDWLPNIWSVARATAEIVAAGFRVVRTRRYMLLPYRYPGHRGVDAITRALLLGRLLLQQAILAQADAPESPALGSAVR